MSTKFFASVRRNQKQWMVVVTVLSMVSFLFLDDLARNKSGLSPGAAAITIGCLCAAAMCIVGYRHQKTTEYGVGGLLVGMAAGYIGFSAIGTNKNIVHTSVGNFSRADLDKLARDRQRLNQFTSQIATKAQTGGQFALFGNIDEASLISTQIWLAEARKMGIQISDDRINDFLRELTQKRLTEKEFDQCFREARLGQSEMFALLKDELAANLALELSRPPAYVPEIPREFARFLQEQREPLQYLQPTPLQLWSDYQKLHVRETLQVAALPVRSFVNQMADPNEDEIGKFFNEHKNRMWVDEARPGFTQLPQVQLAYLTGNIEKFEKAVGEPTETEVREYYEANKERYRTPLIKESTAPALPDEKLQDKKPKEGQDEPAGDATKDTTPANEDKPKTDGADKKDAEPAKEKDQAAESKPEQAAEPKSNCGGDDDADKIGKVESEKVEPAPGNDAADGNTKAAPAGESPANASDPANSEQIELPPPGPGDAPSPPKFRDLDDELKLIIRDTILREKALALSAVEVDKAFKLMNDLGIEYDAVPMPDKENTDEKKKYDEKRKELGKTFAEQLKAFAQEHQLEYHETPLVTQQELSTEALGEASSNQNSVPVWREVFEVTERSERIPAYVPRRVDNRFRGGAYVYWKLSYSPPHIADLTKESVRADVVKAWKFDQARKQAEKRANELAAKVKAQSGGFAAALSGESVTGEKTDSVITVIPTEEFTWLTTNRSIPGARSGPVISTIPPLNQVGESFMETVFQKLGEGEIGVASDDTQSVYYVVQVQNRDNSKSEDGGLAKREFQQKFMKEEFGSALYPLMKTSYQWLAQVPQFQIENAWGRRFQEQHEVSWDDSATAPRRQRR